MQLALYTLFPTNILCLPIIFYSQFEMGANQSPESVDKKIEIDYLKNAKSMPNAGKKYMYLYYLTHGTSDYIDSELKNAYRKSLNIGYIPICMFLPFGILSVIQLAYKTSKLSKYHNAIYAGVFGSILTEMALLWRSRNIRNRIEDGYPDYCDYSYKRITDSLKSKGLI
jgi:hypothetical protein